MTPELTSSYGFLIFKMIAASCAVIGLAVFILKFVLPRIATGRINKQSAIQILDFQVLDAKKTLYIVQIENKRVALGVTEHNINKITDLTDATEKTL